MKYLQNFKACCVIVALSFFFVFSACDTPPKVSEINKGISSLVYAYTSGVISNQGEVKIKLNLPAIDKDKIGTTLDPGLFEISPSVRGKAIWEDAQTIVFKPAKSFESGTQYLVDLKLKGIYAAVPEGANAFVFDFHVKDQFLSLKLKGFDVPNTKEMEVQNYKGLVFTGDVASEEAFTEMLTATQNRKSLPIRWTHSKDGLMHEFVVEEIERGNKDSEFQLEWNGEAIGVDQYGEKEIIVPSLGAFRLLNVRLETLGNPHILAQFSDPLLANQNFAGLVEIKDYKNRLKFAIDGNNLKIFPSKGMKGNKDIAIKTGIRNYKNELLEAPGYFELSFEEEKPKVRIVGNGSIIPGADGLILPFEAIALNRVDVEVVKIFESNILQFLQVNEISGSDQLERVGKLVLQKTFALNTLNEEVNEGSWTRYALDLASMIEDDPNAIYQVRIGFKQEYAYYLCESKDPQKDNQINEEDLTSANTGKLKSFWGGYYGRSGYYSGYRYWHREDPCYEAYYNPDNFASRNVVSSDIGLVAKKGTNGQLFIAATDLVSAKPLSNVTIELFDYQQRPLDAITTQGNGIAEIVLPQNAFFLVASKGGKRGYLKLNNNTSLSVSKFEVGGAKPQKGIKGFIYGERGVWRPGDSIYLNFVLEDKEESLPGNHPVSLELIDPRGKLHTQLSQFVPTGNVYDFHLKTNREDPTGNWLARVKVGGAVFNKTLKIETVKPNRLKIKLDIPEEGLFQADLKKDQLIQVDWLHGAPGSNLKTIVEAQVKSGRTNFEDYQAFLFDDPARKFEGSVQTIFEGKVDKDGTAKFPLKINVEQDAPGKMNVFFKTRAFEKGGDFSSDNVQVPFSPYAAYAGIKLPKNKYGSKRMDIDKSNSFEAVVVDEKGNPLANRKLNMGLYKVDWRWWWDRGEENVASYNSASHASAIKTEKTTTNSRGKASFSVKPEQWGRYLVRICDEETGHCTGDFFYSGQPWYGSGGTDRSAAAMLPFTIEKESYNVGEKIKLNIPTGESGKALITLENGTQVIQSFWMDAKKGDNVFEVEATAAMSPTVYAHVTLLQPHGSVKNDLPIRMYGVVPTRVVDPNTQLEPILDMPETIRPKETFSVKVKETKGKPMAYTLAIVDDGLLDLTRFKTPDPWNHFFAKEALGVKTWDLYDHVLGAHTGEMAGMLSVGGDDAVGSAKSKKANRFKPVVLHVGPFYLKAGETAQHDLTMPNYVGSVRAMVVASGDHSYGNAEKTVPVKQPLMVLATLPRVLGPGETLSLPVNVFAMEESVKKVDISIESSDLIEIKNGTTATLNFTKVGEQMKFFDLKVKEGLGIAKVKVSVQSGAETATQEIEIQVRNPNPFVTEVISAMITDGEDWETGFDLLGINGTNQAALEISSIPPLNLDKRLKYLLRYPHGCVEQTTSSGFPQLYVDHFIDLDSDQKAKLAKNVQATINRLKLFQVPSGGFTYWPGNTEVSSWGSSYAGHFLVEAKSKGYEVPEKMIDDWVNNQLEIAGNWAIISQSLRSESEMIQAYRLYTLALAGSADLASMNALRERKDLSNSAAWMIAAAYAKDGKKSVARKIIANLTTEVKPYRSLAYSYGSDLRDKAVILETLSLIDEPEQAAELVQEICEKLGNQSWWSTQSIAFSLTSLGKFLGDNNTQGEISFEYSIGNRDKAVAGTNLPVWQKEISPDALSTKRVKVKNTSGKVLFARLILSGQPAAGETKSYQNNLEMEVSYFDLEGKKIDVSRLKQGTDFIAEVFLKTTNYRDRYDEMALEQIFPSGWEIHNPRMSDVSEATNEIKPDYQDVRDDRVYTYFDILKNQKQVFRVQLNAAYSGRYYLPSVKCEAMYDNDIQSRSKGQWVEVVAIN